MKTITFTIALTALAAITNCQRTGRFPPRRTRYSCDTKEEIRRLLTNDKWIGVCCVFYYRELFPDGVNVEEPNKIEEQLEELRRIEPEKEQRERNPHQPPSKREPKQELRRIQEASEEPRWKREEQADQPHRRPNKPRCDMHSLELQGENIGQCCAFVGERFHRFQGPLVVVYPTQPLGAAAGTGSTKTPVATTTLTSEITTETEATTGEPLATTTPEIIPDLSTRFFIDSACKGGHVLDANYKCVPEF